MFHKYHVMTVCFLFLSAQASLWAQDTGTQPPSEAGTPEPEKKEKSEKKKKKAKKKDDGGQETEIEEAEEAEPGFKAKLAEHLKTKLVLSTSFGWAKAFKSKKNLRANGLADFKVAYRLPRPVMTKDVFVTFRYLPFSVAPISESSAYQEYRGVVETYNFGLETAFHLHQIFDLLPSFEAGLVNTHLYSQIPIEEDSKPLKPFGGIGSIGLEGRFKPWDLFHIGPRIHVGFGNITVLQFLANASFYF
ncbi:MAG: hypothetical protein HYW48_10825 [Deltaproteobacteria bacterium]|nr:hypothetical protein [Deltaproteobacteria bacterium]